MNFLYHYNTSSIVQWLIGAYVKPHSIVVDMTVGNGKDSLQLAAHLSASGYLYGIDIQKVAVENTIRLLEKEYPSIRKNIICTNHKDVLNYIDKRVDFVIYNLGYLPGGDKSIITTGQDTVLSLERVLQILSGHGIVVLTIYTGHPEGKKEFQLIQQFVMGLSQWEYTVLKYEFLNQRNEPPLLITIEKAEMG